MKKSWLFLIVSMLCLAAPAWSEDFDEDGQTLAAKPGMARLYLIQGFITDGPVPRDAMTDGKPDFYINDTPVKHAEGTGAGVVYVPNGPMGVGGLAGAAIVALLKQSPEERPTVFTHKQRYLGPMNFYWGDKKIGQTKESQYVAADLAPGQYDIRLDGLNGGGPVAPLSLAAGDVVYLIADFDLYYRMMFEVCHKDCGEMIRKQQRVPAFPKPGSNIPNF